MEDMMPLWLFLTVVVTFAVAYMIDEVMGMMNEADKRNGKEASWLRSCLRILIGWGVPILMLTFIGGMWLKGYDFWRALDWAGGTIIIMGIGWMGVMVLTGNMRG